MVSFSKTEVRFPAFFPPSSNPTRRFHGSQCSLSRQGQHSPHLDTESNRSQSFQEAGQREAKEITPLTTAFNLELIKDQRKTSEQRGSDWE